MQKLVLLIFWSCPLGDGVFEIEDVLKKETKMFCKTNFYIFCFCFLFKMMLLVLLLWFYHIIVIKLLT